MTVSSARRKLRRADLHFEVLKSELEMFSQSDCYSIRLEKDHERSENKLVCRWVIDRLDATPVHWPLLVGDIVHNLRSALDHAVWAVVVAKHGDQYAQRKRGQIEFPICKADDGTFEGRKVLDHVGSGVRAVMERSQPYVVTPIHTQRDPLWTLHQIWNADKHRELSVVHLVAHTAHIRTRPALPGVEITLADGSLHQGAEVARLTTPCERPESEVKVDADIAMEIAVKATPRSAAVPLDLGFRSIRDRVDAILTALGFGAENQSHSDLPP